MPIPEKRGTLFHPGLERRYREVLPSLESFCGTHRRDLFSDLRFPRVLLQHAMHLDPDFDMLTYGDDGARRGAGIREMQQGDLLVFYGGLRPIHDCGHKLIYALLGLYVVAEVAPATSMPAKCWHENAHVRRRSIRPTDIVVRAKPKLSGRFERCIPIGEWREGAYRVRKDVLNAWGGLSVRDGYIQRSAVPPQFHKPASFLKWLEKQAASFIGGNNYALQKAITAFSGCESNRRSRRETAF